MENGNISQVKNTGNTDKSILKGGATGFIPSNHPGANTHKLIELSNAKSAIEKMNIAENGGKPLGSLNGSVSASAFQISKTAAEKAAMVEIIKAENGGVVPLVEEKVPSHNEKRSIASDAQRKENEILVAKAALSGDTPDASPNLMKQSSPFLGAAGDVYDSHFKGSNGKTGVARENVEAFYAQMDELYLSNYDGK